MAYTDITPLYYLSPTYDGFATKDEIIHECIRQSSKRTSELLQATHDRGITNKMIIERTGIDKGYLSRMHRPEGKELVPIDYMQHFCSQYFGISSHDLCFGERKDLVLPKRYAIMTERLGYGWPDKIARLYNVLKRKYRRNSVSPINTKTAPTTFAQRVQELADEYGRNTAALQNAPAYMSQSPNIPLGIIYTLERAAANVKSPVLRNVMAVAGYFGVPIDYLICQDYTVTCPDDIYYCDSRGQIIKIEPGSWEIKYLSLVLNARAEDQPKILAEVYAAFIPFEITTDKINALNKMLIESFLIDDLEESTKDVSKQRELLVTYGLAYNRI